MIEVLERNILRDRIIKNYMLDITSNLILEIINISNSSVVIGNIVRIKLKVLDIIE